MWVAVSLLGRRGRLGRPRGAGERCNHGCCVAKRVPSRTAYEETSRRLAARNSVDSRRRRDDVELVPRRRADAGEYFLRRRIQGCERGSSDDTTGCIWARDGSQGDVTVLLHRGRVGIPDRAAR